MTDMPTDHDARDAPSPPPSGGSAIYFDGTSNRRRAVTLRLADRLEISEGETTLGAWAYADIRRADSPPSTLRLSCVTAPALARLEVRDSAVAAEQRLDLPIRDVAEPPFEDIRHQRRQAIGGERNPEQHDGND